MCLLPAAGCLLPAQQAQALAWCHQQCALHASFCSSPTAIPPPTPEHLFLMPNPRSYVDYVLDVPMYFVYRNGTYHNAAGQSFRDFLQGKLPALPGAICCGWGN